MRLGTRASCPADPAAELTLPASDKLLVALALLLPTILSCWPEASVSSRSTAASSKATAAAVRMRERRAPAAAAVGACTGGWLAPGLRGCIEAGHQHTGGGTGSTASPTNFGGPIPP